MQRHRTTTACPSMAGEVCSRRKAGSTAASRHRSPPSPAHTAAHVAGFQIDEALAVVRPAALGAQLAHLDLTLDDDLIPQSLRRERAHTARQVLSCQVLGLLSREQQIAQLVDQDVGDSSLLRSGAVHLEREGDRQRGLRADWEGRASERDGERRWARKLVV